MQHRLKNREQLEQLGRHLRRPRSVGQAHRQIFLDRQAGEDLAPLRNVADTAADPLVRRLHADVDAVEVDAARAHGHDAHQAFQQRRLANAVAAEHDRDLAHRRFERDAAQDVRAAVVLVERLDLEKRLGVLPLPRAGEGRGEGRGRRKTLTPARSRQRERDVSGQGRPRRLSRRPERPRATLRPARCLRATP